ncbi:hypothetical protein SAMD00019534_115840 [Acytostelium subglobosum LB1]|uniref:hypothetical protein n=1 Tax=Acytostelium subglobosum LB1 TaxID=1410327 RepID=UPI00064511BC|nr:hypothetical protein SAMD00019534_115840 [Acytostelium subglobosum LB1]GAM28408.1 hypothetical protein SAMD00019534_115840 [Acytostelium subglobosum LB1]|eukprot:XP_012748725.1 hypothetical protein SAMD00019534_115840 [Acytostelium subglobosum LB1]
MNDTVIDGLGKYQWVTITNVSFVSLFDVSVRNCFTNESGSVARVLNGSVFWSTRVRYARNKSLQIGGAISVLNGTLNYSGRNGGAVSCSFSISYIHLSIFISNWSNSGKGGALHNDFSNSTVSYSQFYYNLAASSGAIDINGLYNTIEYCRFVQNRANVGGAVAAYILTFLEMDNNLLIENTANLTSGAVFVSAEASAIIHESIFDRNYAPNTGIIATHASSPLSIERCIFYNSKKVVSAQIGIFDSYSMMRVTDCSFRNLSGPIFYSNAMSISVIYYSSFKYIPYTLVHLKHQAAIAIAGCYIGPNHLSNSAILLEFGSFVALFNTTMTRNRAPNMISCLYQSHVLMYNCFLTNNTVENALIFARYEYLVLSRGNYYVGNLGKNRGCVFEIDQTGSMAMIESVYESNVAVWGPILFLTTSTIMGPSGNDIDCLRETFSNNHAIQAGPLFYYYHNVTNRVIFSDVKMFNNTDPYSNSIIARSSYEYFLIKMPRLLYPFQSFNITIQAYDNFGNLIVGRTDLAFFMIPCKNVYMEGVTSGTLNVSGQAILQDIKMSATPGEMCNLTFVSVPTPSIYGAYYLEIEFTKCPDSMVHLETYVYFCLDEVRVSTTPEIIAGVILCVLLVFIILCFVITIVFRKKRVIKYSNPIFLCIILFGCALCVISGGTFFLPVKTINCYVPLIIFPLSIFLVTNSVFVKQFSMWRLVEDIEYLRDTIVENKYLLKFVAVLMVIPVIIIVLSTTVVKTESSYYYDFDKLNAIFYCRTNHYYVFLILFLVYQSVILLFGCYLVVVCRKFRMVPGTFNEATYIGILIYNYMIILITSTPLIFSFRKDPTATFLIIELCIILFVASTITLVFFPKFNFLVRNRAIIQSLKKHIEEQENSIRKNKEVLRFYHLYMDGNGVSRGFPLSSSSSGTNTGTGTGNANDSIGGSNSRARSIYDSDDEYIDFNQHIDDNRIRNKKKKKASKKGKATENAAAPAAGGVGTPINNNNITGNVQQPPPPPPAPTVQYVTTLPEDEVDDEDNNTGDTMDYREYLRSLDGIRNNRHKSKLSMRETMKEVIRSRKSKSEPASPAHFQ